MGIIPALAVGAPAAVGFILACSCSFAEPGTEAPADDDGFYCESSSALSCSGSSDCSFSNDPIARGTGVFIDGLLLSRR